MVKRPIPTRPRTRKTDLVVDRVMSRAVISKPVDPRQADLFADPLAERKPPKPGDVFVYRADGTKFLFVETNPRYDTRAMRFESRVALLAARIAIGRLNLPAGDDYPDETAPDRGFLRAEFNYAARAGIVFS
jgi:hypothetical protein